MEGWSGASPFHDHPCSPNIATVLKIAEADGIRQLVGLPSTEHSPIGTERLIIRRRPVWVAEGNVSLQTFRQNSAESAVFGVFPTVLP